MSSEPTIAERLASATAALKDVTDTPRLDAEILLARALGISRSKLLARLHERPSVEQFDEMIDRRLNYEPLAYILGDWEFFSLNFKVAPPLLVPRPETEHLVEAVLDAVGPISQSDRQVLELGTGTGCVSISIAKNAPKTKIIATDINPLALEIAAQNAAIHHVSNQIEFRQGDLFDPVKDMPNAFDVICSNPPYIEEDAWPDLSPVIRLHEDPKALLAGKDGLDVIRNLIATAPQFLKSGGILAFEIGMGQHEAVAGLLRKRGYQQIAFRRDLAGIERIACALTNTVTDASRWATQ